MHPSFKADFAYSAMMGVMLPLQTYKAGKAGADYLNQRDAFDTSNLFDAQVKTFEEITTETILGGN